jgi:hypothetical protein
MRMMADLLRPGYHAREIMPILAVTERQTEQKARATAQEAKSAHDSAAFFLGIFVNNRSSG